MLLYIHNVGGTVLNYNDIGLSINAAEYHILETSSLNDFLREPSELRTSILNPLVYGTNLVLSLSDNPLETGSHLSAEESIAVLTNGSAHEVLFRKLSSSLTSTNVRDAIEEVASLLGDTAAGLTWREPVLAITSDPRISDGGTISFPDSSLPFSDDAAPDNFVSIPEGAFILFEGATDRLYLKVGDDLVEQTGVSGLVGGYAFLVKNDLLETEHSRENAAIYIFTTSSGLQKIGDVDWNAIDLQSAYDKGNEITLQEGRDFTIYSSDEITELIKVTQVLGSNYVNIHGDGDAGTAGVSISSQNQININTQGTIYSTSQLEHVITSSSGDIQLEAFGNLTLNDGFLTGPINLSEDGADNFDAAQWSKTQTGVGGIFDFTRPYSPDEPTSIVGGLVSLRDDLNEYITLISTSPVTTGVDANGSNLIGAKGIDGVTPTGGAVGEDSNLQAMLEGIATIASSGNSYENGLTLDTGVVRLGGSLNQNTFIDTTEDYDFIVGRDNLPPNSGGNGLYIGNHIEIGLQDTGFLAFYSSAGGTAFFDTRNPGEQVGIVYFGDYENDFVDRSLVTKQYVDTAVGNAGGKTFTDTAAFTAAKTDIANNPFNVGEVVFIQDINRFVKILTSDNDIVEGTGWNYVGSSLDAVSGAPYHYGTSLVLHSTTSAVAGSDTSGATYYDTEVASIMTYDEVRSKYISAHKQLLQFGASNANGQYLTINGVQSGLSGFLMPRNAVVTGITVKQAGGNQTKGFEIRVDGSLVGSSFVLDSGVYSDTLLNINIPSGSFVQLFAAAAGAPARNVVATIEIAYYK